jgi:hypothetical protein
MSETVQKVYVKRFSPPFMYKICTSIRPPPFPFHYSTYHWTLVVSTHDSVVARQAVCIRIRLPQASSRHHCCFGKAISITYSECVSVDLLIQHAKLMRHFVFSSVPCAALLKFSTLSHKNFVNAWTCEHCSDPE